MKINYNIPALRTLNQLNKANNKSATTMERLSSGLRINRSADDAAGLAIANKMDAQIKGLKQANRNAMDGISLVQTAEGALNEVHAMLQRMRELSVQAANGTYSEGDLVTIQQEINQLTEEIDRIAETTEFNTKPLLKGNGSKTDLFLKDIVFDKGAERIDATYAQGVLPLPFTYDSAAINRLNGEKLTIQQGGRTLVEINFWNGIGTEPKNAINITEIKADDKGNYRADLGDKISEKLTSLGFETVSSPAQINIQSNQIGTAGNDIELRFLNFRTEIGGGTDAIEEVKSTAKMQIPTDMTEAELKKLEGKYFTILPDGIKIGFSDVESLIKEGESPSDALGRFIAERLTEQGFESSYNTGVIEIKANRPGIDEEIKIVDGDGKNENNITLQIGANKDQILGFGIGDMRTDALGLTGKPGEEGYTDEATIGSVVGAPARRAALSVLSQTAAGQTIKKLDDVIEKVSNQRSALGAVQNRLEYTTSNLGTSEENMTSSLSRIQDADMAYEMAQYTQQNVLSQAATAMLAQANQRPQQVMQLLQR